MFGRGFVANIPYGYVQKGIDSDVFVHFDGKLQTYVCDGCILESPTTLHSCESAWDMLAHLSEHDTAGHKVPLWALADLKKAAEGDDSDIAWLKAPLTDEEKTCFADHDPKGNP